MDDRQTILEALARAGLTTLVPKVEMFIKPAIAVAAHRATDELAVGASRFGGHPDLPRGTAWPTREDVPMQFVAQVHLADVISHDVEALLPRTGWLLFFFNEQWEAFTDNGYECATVIYWDGDVETLALTPAPRVEYSDEYGHRTAPGVYPVASLTFAPMLDVPEMGAFLAGDDLADVRAVWDNFLYEHADELPPIAPSARNQMLGYLEQHDDMNAMSTDDVLLFQIDSDDQAEFDWGKRHFLYFIVAKTDLAVRDFSRVRVYHNIAC